MFPEVDELRTGKDNEVAALVGTPGKALLATIGSGPIRGAYLTSNGLLYVASGLNLYAVDRNYASTNVGPLLNTTGPIAFSDNGFELVAVDGTNGYYVPIDGSQKAYTFTVTSGQTASQGATYTNNGKTFTVTKTLMAGDTTLYCNGTGDPGTTSGNLTYVTGTGTGPIAFSSWISNTNAFLTLIVDPNWLGANDVTFQDDYFIFNQPNTKKFYISDLNAITFATTVISSKAGFPDNLIGLESLNRNLWLFGDVTTETWFNSGDATNPFQYIAGSLMQYGLAATFSLKKMTNTLFWLGKDATGQGVVFMANGPNAQRISTTAVELAIQSYSTISDAIAWAYQENGHNFYQITFPTGNATWVYDLSTGMWHERASLDSSGNFQRDRANCYVFAFGNHIVGDYQNGNLYKQSLSTFTDNGAPLVRQRVTPHLSKDMVRIFYNTFQLDIEAGVGTDGTNQGNSPQAMLQWSNDGGHTWSTEFLSMFGKIGATKGRAIWRRLGASRNRVFKVSISDPVKVVIMGAEVDLMAGNS